MEGHGLVTPPQHNSVHFINMPWYPEQLILVLEFSQAFKAILLKSTTLFFTYKI